MTSATVETEVGLTLASTSRRNIGQESPSKGNTRGWVETLFVQTFLFCGQTNVVQSIYSTDSKTLAVLGLRLSRLFGPSDLKMKLGLARMTRFSSDASCAPSTVQLCSTESLWSLLSARTWQ